MRRDRDNAGESIMYVRDQRNRLRLGSALFFPRAIPVRPVLPVIRTARIFRYIILPVFKNVRVTIDGTFHQFPDTASPRDKQ